MPLLCCVHCLAFNRKHTETTALGSHSSAQKETVNKPKQGEKRVVKLLINPKPGTAEGKKEDGKKKQKKQERNRMVDLNSKITTVTIKRLDISIKVNNF